jgi:hypothetical protein
MAVSFEGREKFEKGIEEKLAGGERREDIAAELVALGWSPEDAVILVDRIHRRSHPEEAKQEDKERNKDARRAGIRMASIGLLFLAGGVPLSVFAYMGARSTSSAISYIVHAPLVVGAALFCTGLRMWIKARWGSSDGARYWLRAGPDDE